MLKLQGLNKAIGDYHRANSGNPYSPRYGYLMLDKSTGEIWTDEFYDLGHNKFKRYHSSDIVNLGFKMESLCYEITRENVKEFCLVKYGIVSEYLKCKYMVEWYDGVAGCYIECKTYKEALKEYAYRQKELKKVKNAYVEINKYTINNKLVQRLFKTIYYI